MLELLLEFGNYINQKDFKGRTPLYLSSVTNNKEMCAFLLKNNANIHQKDNRGYNVSDVAGSKELKYYLLEAMSQPYSNPEYKQRVLEFLKNRRKRIFEALKKKIQENEKAKVLEKNENEE